MKALRTGFLLVSGLSMAGALAAPTGAPRAQEPRTAIRPRWAELAVPGRPSTPENLSELAERIYGWNCMPCHGAEGKGDGPVAQRLGLRPRDLSRGTYKLRTSDPGGPPCDEDLYRTLTVGVPAAGMPAFSQFDARERWALVDFVKRLAGGWESPKAAELPPRPATVDLLRGKTLFRNTVGCAVCHGPGGKGEGPAAAGLVDSEGRPLPIPDLTRGPLSFKAGDRAQDIVRVLSLGMPGSPMPAFPALGGADRWDLAAYVESLYEEIPEGERTWLTAGCQGCHTAGRGKLVGPDLAGVGRRRNRDWLRRWLSDPPRMLEDPVLKAEFRDYPAPMPKLDLTAREVDLLVDFLSALPSPR